MIKYVYDVFFTHWNESFSDIRSMFLDQFRMQLFSSYVLFGYIFDIQRFKSLLLF